MTRRVILPLVAVVAIVIIVVVIVSMRGESPTPPTPPETRTTGPWVDSIVITTETSPSAAVLKMGAGDIDIWWMLAITDPDLFETILQHPDIEYDLSYGHFTELMFNVAGPRFHDGTLNPFHDAEIREAFNWLIDREYFVGELLGGMGMPIYALDGKAFPEYDRYPDILAAIEAYYAHDPDKASDIIHDRMVALGAELVDETWHYDGAEVTIKFIIRTDLYHPLYPAGGEYIADLMEWVGFEVDRMLLPLSSALSIWQHDDPYTGTYHAATLGWSITEISRDKGYRFYTSDTKFVRPWPRWQSLEPPAEYLEVAKRLYDRDYETMDERRELFEEALWMRMEFSPQILLADIAGANPYRSTLAVRTDLSSGFGWGVPQTIHFIGEDGEPVIGGTVRGEQYLALVDPWNPVDGSAAVADLNIFRNMLQERGLMPDGRDGLLHPWRIDSAAITVKQGLPVIKTYDWVTLDFTADIQAPSDAWVDWDAVAQKFIAVGEKMDPESPYYDEDFDPAAHVKSVVYYPADFYDVPMHDGSTLSLADVIMSWIMRFDRAKEESSVYDEGEVPRLEAFMANFRGVKVVSEDPLVIESYSKQWFLDAEANVSTWFPSYGVYSQFAPWHVIAIGKLAEKDLALAWSTDKSATLLVEWMDYTKGPSLDILRGYLDAAIADTYIPYQPTLGDYITPDEAAERYANLKAWNDQVGHFWTTTAPFYLHAVYPVQKIIELRRFEGHPDPIDRWMFLLGDL
ncbi:MAG: ABC transporter substrate-binding protein [Dehalococcoidia bacterium]